MKNRCPRLIALILCLTLMLCASCRAFAETSEPDAETFGALMSDYTTETVLARHQSWQRVLYIYKDEEPVYGMYNYDDAENCMQIYTNGYAALSRPDLRVDWFAQEEGYYYNQILFDTMEVCQEMFRLSSEGPIVSLPEGEVLIETIDAGDGLFVGTTEISDPALVKKELDDSESKGGYAYEEGMVLRYQYTFDKETGDLLGTSETMIDPQGETHAFEEASFAYDEEPYGFAEEDAVYAAYFAAAADPERVRTIRLTFAPDTEDEHTIEWIVPDDVKCDIYYNDAYVQQLYTDRACTQPYDSDDCTVDVDLYIK